MGDEFPAQAPHEVVSSTTEDADGDECREERLRHVLRRADDRDRAAEHRDHEAAARSSNEFADRAMIDRDWAARDREGAAADRADLLGLIRELEARRSRSDGVD